MHSRLPTSKRSPHYTSNQHAVRRRPRKSCPRRMQHTTPQCRYKMSPDRLRSSIQRCSCTGSVETLFRSRSCRQCKHHKLRMFRHTQSQRQQQSSNQRHNCTGPAARRLPRTCSPPGKPHKSRSFPRTHSTSLTPTHSPPNTSTSSSRRHLHCSYTQRRKSSRWRLSSPCRSSTPPSTGRNRTQRTAQCLLRTFPRGI